MRPPSLAAGGLLAPGSVLSGIAMPGVAQLESIRAPASENAAPWLHLLAASVARDRGDPASSAGHRDGQRGAASRSARCHSAGRAVLPAPAARLPRRTGTSACHPVQLCACRPKHSADWRRSSPALRRQRGADRGAAGELRRRGHAGAAGDRPIGRARSSFCSISARRRSSPRRAPSSRRRRESVQRDRCSPSRRICVSRALAERRPAPGATPRNLE